MTSVTVNSVTCPGKWAACECVTRGTSTLYCGHGSRPFYFSRRKEAPSTCMIWLVQIQIAEDFPNSPKAQNSICMKVKVLVVQSCLTLHNRMNCSPPSSSVHGILQARILEWAAIPFVPSFVWLNSNFWNHTPYTVVGFCAIKILIFFSKIDFHNS